ncbi:hypothetical protein [Oscillibacter sp.]|uniref:hypothetical protein n=1 Tax=Oscillibacter sp. TaxID=1945593 RepID=UPI00339AAF6B
MIDTVAVKDLAEQFGINNVTLLKRLDRKNVPIVNESISKVDADKILYIKQNFTSLSSIIERYFFELKGKVIWPDYTEKLTVYATGYHFWGAVYIKNPVHRKDKSEAFYVLNTNIEVVKRNIREQILLYSVLPHEKLNFLINETKLNTYSDTINLIKKLLLQMDKKNLTNVAEVSNYLRYKLQKEFRDYNDDEMIQLMAATESDLSGPARAFIIDLYNFAKEQGNCKSNLYFNYNKHLNEPVTSQIHPYDLNTYFSIAYMTLNKSYWVENNMLQKAVHSEYAAKIWLYHLMHYICAWRSKDILKRLPRIEINDDPKNLLQKILEENCSEAYFRNIAELVFYQFRYNGYQKPLKTAAGVNTPSLKFNVPESIKPVFGMLALICECHNRINNKNMALCEITRLEATQCIKLYGESYCKVLSGKVFSNRRANKNYMNMLSEKAEKTGVDGYLLAAFVRSHTGGIDKIPEVTSRYLKAKMDGYSPDEIVKCLMERGVCSFVPYMLCAAIEGNSFKQKRITQQTLEMKAIALSPAQIESILNTDAELATICRERVQEIIKLTSSQNVDEIAKRMLSNIIDGECYGKTEGIYCLSKACYMGCQQKQRESCIGCGYEMYIKSLLLELSIEITRQETLSASAKTTAERVKHTMILKGKLYPASHEILKTIKHVYGQDTSDFISILKRSGEYGVIGDH